MAEFCHDFDPGGLGGNHPLGDFEYIIQDIKDGKVGFLEPGDAVYIGVCEGHGCYICLFAEEDGSYTLRHDGKAIPNCSGEPIPKPVKVILE